jgi:hypothetical protein
MNHWNLFAKICKALLFPFQCKCYGLFFVLKAGLAKINKIRLINIKH